MGPAPQAVSQGGGSAPGARRRQHLRVASSAGRPRLAALARLGEHAHRDELLRRHRRLEGRGYLEPAPPGRLRSGGRRLVHGAEEARLLGDACCRRREARRLRERGAGDHGGGGGEEVHCDLEGRWNELILEIELLHLASFNQLGSQDCTFPII